MENHEARWIEHVRHSYSKSERYGIALAAHLFFVGALFAISYTITQQFSLSIVGSLILWFAIYVSWGLSVIREKEFVVIERAGKFLRVKFAGPLLSIFPPLVDRVRGPVSLKYQSFELYPKDADGKRVKINFKDISASAVVKVNFAVTRLVFGEAEKNYDPVPDIIRFTYYHGDPIEYVRSIMDKFLRIHLECGTHDSFQHRRDLVSTALHSDEGVHSALAEVGVYLSKNEPLVIQDIIVPVSARHFRRKRLEAEVSANFDKKRGEGYGGAIREIMEQAKEEGTPITTQEAVKIFEFQEALEGVKKMPGKINFVGSSIGELLDSIGRKK